MNRLQKHEEQERMLFRFFGELSSRVLLKHRYFRRDVVTYATGAHRTTACTWPRAVTTLAHVCVCVFVN